MLIVNSIPILVPIQTIVHDLSMNLKLEGRNTFHSFKQSGINIITNCPFHTDNKPSFSILVQDKGEIMAGHYNCFSCHRHGTLSELISKLLFGIEKDFGIQGDKWLIDNYAEYELENRDSILILPHREEKKEIIYVPDSELDKYAYYHPYIINKRGIDKRIIDLFDVGYDAHFKLKESGNEIPSITFPVRDIDGNCLFVARRAIRSKLFNYPASVLKPLYGIYELSRVQNWESKTLFITESIINCLTIWSAGGYAVALNGTGDEMQYEAIKNLPCRNIVLALDTGDNAGMNGTIKLWNALKDYKLLSWVKFNTKKDINDLWNEVPHDNFLQSLKKAESPLL